MSKPADYYSSFNHDLLALIPPDAKTVLEIGCGEGTLCEAYRRINPGVAWKGVDISEAAIKIAITRGVDGYVFDVDTATTIADDETADCIILGDVLEHLRDPWAKLKRLAAVAKPSAQVLACIPNVQHWTIIHNLLEGKWDYADSGLMDRTHLRWFTLKSIREMFDQAGLQVFEIVGRDLFNEGYGGWLSTTGLHAKPEMRAYQYLVRAVKPSTMIYGGPAGNGMSQAILDQPMVEVISKLNIHAVLAEACCARPRILEPMSMLRTIPGVKCTAWPRHLPETSKPEIWIQQRERDFDIERQHTLLGLASIVIAEIDDDPTSPQYNHGQPFDPMPLKAVHAIQCSTEALAEVCRQFNPNVMVFENQIAELPELPERSSDIPWIFFGAQNRQSDWAPIMPAFHRIVRELKKTTGVHVVVVHDREFFDELDEPSVSEFHPFCEYADYRAILRQCDIALLPLEDTPFNRCKSDIKFLECAAEGVAVVASPTVYRATIGGDDCVAGGLWYLTVEQFDNQLRSLIEMPSLRQRIAEVAYERVRDNRLLSQHYRARYEWYQSLLTSKQALDCSLLERCPELQPASSQC